MNRTALTPLLLMALMLAGCASTLSGVGGVDGYACKAPEGAMCSSVSGIYANSAQGMPKPAKPSAQKPPADEAIAYGADSLGTRQDRRRVEFAEIEPETPAAVDRPWEDADGDLHEQALVHVVVDSGRWLIEHVRPATGRRMDGVAPPVPHVQESSPAKAPAEGPQAPTRYPLPPANLSSGAEPVATEP